MSTLFVGLDAGGSKTAVVAARGNEAVSYEQSAAGVNLQRSATKDAAVILADAVHAAHAAFSGIVAICAAAGVAGAGRDEEARDLAERWNALLPTDIPNATVVVHDGIIALEGAFEGESGAVIIAGTGSIVLLRSNRSTYARAGGWGYLVGDEGSGHALGAEGLRAVAASLDGGPPTALAEVMRERFGFATRDELIRAVYRARIPMQALAPSVLEVAAKGDDVCADAVRRQVGALADQLVWAARSESDVSPRVALIGGLTRDTHYSAELTRAIHDRLPEWRVTRPAESPVFGALQLARRLTVRR